MSCQKRRKTLERMFKISQTIEEAVQTASEHPQIECAPYWNTYQNLSPNYRDFTKPAEPRDMKPLQSSLQYFPLLSTNSFETTIFSACNKPLWFSPNALRLHLSLWGWRCLHEVSGKAKSLPEALHSVLILLADRIDNSYTVFLVHLAVSLPDLLVFCPSRCFSLLCV